MKISVIGGGAIGGVIAARLAQGGRDIEVIDIDAGHVAAILASGLTLRTGEARETVRLKARTPAARLAEPEGLECVLLCVKAQHSTEALRPFVERLGPSGFVVSIQNGLCENDIARLVGRERTIGGFTNIFADYLGPAEILYGGKGALSIGELDGTRSDRVLALARELSCLDRITISDNITGLLWSKLAYGAMLTATALTDEEIAAVFDDPAWADLLADLADEILRVAALEGVTCTAFDDWDPALISPRASRNAEMMAAGMRRHVARLRTYTKTRSGIWRDLVVRKRRTEKHYHFRPVFRAAAKHGVEMPLCRRLLELLARIEDGTATTSLDNLHELKRLSEEIRNWQPATAVAV